MKVPEAQKMLMLENEKATLAYAAQVRRRWGGWLVRVR